jgi:two-component system phosphate regulon sensor histidine kinase PhoR
LLLSAVFLLFSFSTIKSHYVSTLAHDLESIGRTLDVRIFEYLDGGRLAELEGFLKEQGKRIGARLTVIGSDGAVKADSELDPLAMEGHRFRPEISEALEGRVGRSIRYSSTLRAQMLYVALPLERQGRVEGALRLSLFVRNIDVLLREIRRDIGRAVGILILLSLAAAFLFSRSLTRPLRLLVRASRRVAAGDFSARVKVRSSDEWRELAASFNAMASDIKRLFDDLRLSKEELDNIMASMDEGLLVLDGAGRITLCNRSAKAIIGQDAPEGKYFWEVVRLTPFVDLVRRVKEEKKSLSEEMFFGENRVLCRASFLPAQDGAVITLARAAGPEEGR